MDILGHNSIGESEAEVTSPFKKTFGPVEAFNRPAEIMSGMSHADFESYPSSA